MVTSAHDHLRADTEFGYLDAATRSEKVFHPVLISNENEDTMLRAIRDELRRSHRFVFSVAFITTGALALLKQALVDFEGEGIIVTSTYLDFNAPDVFRELLAFQGVKTYVHPGVENGFHPKGYVFEQDETTTAIVGSSNLTSRALLKNEEWNLRFAASPGGDIVEQLDRAIDAQLARSRPLTGEWLKKYESHFLNLKRQPLTAPFDEAPGVVVPESDIEFHTSAITPNSMQLEALEAIRSVRESGEQRAVVISATGTGKTILSALDVRTVDPRRMLFIVHREQILDAAMAAYQQVLGVEPEELGKFVGSNRDLDARYVFATIQSISRVENLTAIPPEHFDYVLIDEVHRAGAESYRRVINHLAPDFLLGLTATPERTDEFNVFELFDYNVPYEIRLQAALEENMLSPFHYYGVTDYVDAEGDTVEETSDLARLVSDERVKHLIRTLHQYGHPGDVRGLIFCARRDEAYELADLLNNEVVHGRRLRTRALSGADSVDVRERVVAQLERHELDYIVTVDIFNEGIDIPPVNQIVMLRQTQSSIVFTQQLGRGLRKWPGKDHLRVIDFIGNYANNYLIPIALLGDSSLNKDVIRKKLIEVDDAGAIAGLSSINFDHISRDRVLRSLAQTRLDSMKNLKASYLELERRLGQPPSLYDFARFDTVDPVVLATKAKEYWTLLHKFKRADSPPPPEMSAILQFFSEEVLNGKRPHELLLLRALLQQPSITEREYRELLRSEKTRTDEETIASVRRILSLEFFTQSERNKYGNQPIVDFASGEFTFGARVTRLLASCQTFSRHVQDVVETGLFLARHRYDWSGTLQVGQQYSRKDACRLLNWKANEYSTIYGYKVDHYSNTCPIFVTYHKAEDVSESTQYEDELLDPATLHWYTRSRRTLESAEVRSIVENEIPLHVFVKKDDAEGRDFTYLGPATSRDAVQDKMPGGGATLVDVVTMKLDLESPLEDALYRYFLTSTDPAA